MQDRTIMGQEYGIWREVSGVVYHIPYTYKHVYAVESQFWDAKYYHHMFNQYWHYSIFIAMIYILSIHSLRYWMQNRKPFNLKSTLTVWNATLAIFSIIGFWRMSEEFLYVVKHRSFQDSVCLSLDPNSPATMWALLFAFSKVIELGDTIFVVLRKRPLIFLHWYHHAAVLVYCWHAACVVTAAARWFMIMNYFVHSIMYSYYALSSFGVRLPRIFSIVVTTLQTAQMLVGVFISAYVARLKYNAMATNAPLICQQTNNNLLLCFGIYFTFALLFINFFRTAYLSPRKYKANRPELLKAD